MFWETYLSYVKYKTNTCSGNILFLIFKIMIFSKENYFENIQQRMICCLILLIEMVQEITKFYYDGILLCFQDHMKQVNV